jgi:ribose-phosphate pyrophosphokinase
MESIIFSLDGRVDLMNSILEHYNKISENKNTIIGEFNHQKFSDGELCGDYSVSVRGKRVYLLSSANDSDKIISLILAIDAAKRAAASEIIPILPYFPYARQDKKDQVRGPIGAKVIASMLENAGATSIITFDLHADQIQGFFDIPLTHIEGKNVFDDYIYSISNENTVLCGPDAGSGKRVKRMKDQLLNHYGLDLNYVMMDKTRKVANEVDKMVIIGDVQDKDVIILDDMVDTAGTLCKAASVIIENGAKSVMAIISHGVLSGNAYKNINSSVLKELIISDSLLKKDLPNNIITISIDFQIAKTIASINNNLSYELIK